MQVPFEGVAPGASPTVAFSTLGKIEYTQTATFEVNRNRLRKQFLITGLPPSSYVDSFKVLKTRVQRRLRERGWNTVAVTSPGEGAGTSLVAANLALSLALDVTQTVLLVDANLRAPSLHRSFGLQPEYGLADHLLDGVPLPQILHHPRGIDRFVLLPGTGPVPDSAELMASPATAELVYELKERYNNRVVVFDLPSLRTADALAMASLVDCLLLVVGAGSTGRDELAEALEHLQGIPIIGTVLNRAELERSD